MIRAHLGQTIDIHGGGLDLVFPHHENEAAQSRCAHGAPLARYWLHNGFVDFGAEKMSKSLGNVVTPGELLAAGHKGEVLRLALLSAHYRSPLPWTEALVAQSRATLDSWYRTYSFYETAFVNGTYEPHSAVIDALSEDLNSPAAIGLVSVGLKSIREQVAAQGDTGLDDDAGRWFAAAKLMGFLTESAESWFRGNGDAAIDALVAERTAAKKARDFATSDRIRDELKEQGILLEDGPQGTTWRRA
jgi:cysteinyl-tRNA synthetase